MNLQTQNLIILGVKSHHTQCDTVRINYTQNFKHNSFQLRAEKGQLSLSGDRSTVHLFVTFTFSGQELPLSHRTTTSWPRDTLAKEKSSKQSSQMTLKTKQGKLILSYLHQHILIRHQTVLSKMNGFNKIPTTEFSMEEEFLT